MKPFENITVLEFSTMITASFAAMMMADQGARVIKVEPMDMGDPMRYIGATKGGISALFANCNRGKQSIKVDLKQAAGQQLILDLIPQVDVVIHNFRPGVMDSLGLGSASLRGINPRLVYLAVSGFGTTGPLAKAPAYDPIIQAHVGMTASQGGEGHTFIRNLMCDKITAYTAMQAVTGALLVRANTGEGQHVDLAMIDAGLFFIYPDSFMNDTLLDPDIAAQPLLSDLIYELTETQDGAITMSAATDRQRAGVLKALGKESMMSDPRFNSMESLLQNIDAYRESLADAFKQLPTDVILARLIENEVPAARCLSRAEVLNQGQLESNGTLVERDHPLMGSMRLVRSPAKFNGESLPVAGHAPAHGQDTDQVLADFGLSSDAREALKAAGAVA
ncbi:MAG TPA: carnitine dehydratase [Gammaproteobacteria bacterium]|jgi:crotonobetainyl-CoA:carnitine CoA-transferase CaiB-like acyl-CoA transferase|nr:CoA transferase [Gammaproteobacteria bacterium]MDB2510061.1 CoA transferase [Pseudomonadales bacterium]MDB3978817.1 CoA transferase [Pseudomonadales bacterium]MDB3985415.1 CoA transferase [Pseudomonadales bacterium]HAB45344.1 carnitine dehydratase [Gammaproteobacteria bacterium]